MEQVVHRAVLRRVGGAQKSWEATYVGVLTCTLTSVCTQGVGEIIRSTDNIFGDGEEGVSVQDEVERDTFDLTIDFLEARMLNKSAGASSLAYVGARSACWGSAPTGLGILPCLFGGLLHVFGALMRLFEAHPFWGQPMPHAW